MAAPDLHLPPPMSLEGAAEAFEQLDTHPAKRSSGADAIYPRHLGSLQFSSSDESMLKQITDKIGDAFSYCQLAHLEAIS